MFIVVLVVSDTIAETHFACEPRLRKELECSVDCSLANTRVLLLDETVQIFAGKMLFGAQKDIENQIALGGALESPLLNVFQKNFLLFSHDGSCEQMLARILTPRNDLSEDARG
jgi:hypothetical protein